MRAKTVILTFLALLIVSAALFWLPSDEESFKSENRTRTALPKLTAESFFSGSFMKDFENYTDDRISFRSEMIAAGRFLSNHKGITPPDGKIVYTNKDIGTETVQKACMLIADGKIMEVFRKNETAEKKYAAAINHIAENIDEKINMYSILVPTQLEFSDRLYSSIQTNQKKTIDEIYGMLNPRVQGVDVYSPLKNHADEYIYYRSDHHWTMLGSYYGYSAFMKAQNAAPVSISNFEKHDDIQFLGYLYEKCPDESVKKNPDTLVWYDTQKTADLTIEMQSIKNGKVNRYTSPMFDKSKKNYDFFFSADHPYTQITNRKLPQGKTLLVIKDSFASNFVPWCVNNYHEIIMIDPRNYQGNLREVFQKNKIDDVLILNYIFTTSFEDYCDKMINLFR